jgi:hypothetical protein
MPHLGLSPRGWVSASNRSFDEIAPIFLARASDILASCPVKMTKGINETHVSQILTQQAILCERKQ